MTAGATLAQDKQDLTNAQQAEGRLILETARNLVSYGETKGDALALVTAAKLMARRSRQAFWPTARRAMPAQTRAPPISTSRAC